MHHRRLEKSPRIFCGFSFFFLFCLFFSFNIEKFAMAQTAMPSAAADLFGQNSIEEKSRFNLLSPTFNELTQSNINSTSQNTAQINDPLINFNSRLNGLQSREFSTFQNLGNDSAVTSALNSAVVQEPSPNSAMATVATTDQGTQEPPSTNQSDSNTSPALGGGGSRVDVGNSSAFARALDNARCGQSIIVGNGTYSGNFSVEANCSGSKPLIIRAATPQRAIIESLLEVRGAHIHLRGFHFRGGNAHMRVYGEHQKVIGNKFEGWAVNTALSLHRGRFAEVSYNEFTKPDPFRTGNLGNYPLRIGIRSSHSSSQFHSDAHIHHNYFHDFPAKPDPKKYHSGQSDAIEVCFTGSTARSGWLIEYNLIDRHQQGHGVIDVKCANGTVVRFNTLINSPSGRIDLRSGNGGKVIANWVENAGGIGIQADNHEIVGNVLRGSGYPELVLGTGNVASNGVNAETQSANRNTLTCNRGTHNIGKYNMQHPARDNVVNAADGRVILGRQVNTRVSPNANCNSVPQARRLSANEVGLQGLARSGS